MIPSLRLPIEMDLMISVILSGHSRNIRELPPENTNEDKITTDIFPPDLNLSHCTKKGGCKKARLSFFASPFLCTSSDFIQQKLWQMSE